jgi:hypothetical protein
LVLPFQGRHANQQLDYQLLHLVER